MTEVIEIIVAGGVRVAALANGSNLKGRVADAFAKHGTWVKISLDAWDDGSYVKSRGAKAHDFSRLIENIRAFTAHDKQCVLGVSLIVGQDNHQHILDVCTLLKDCKVNHVKVPGAVVSNDAEGNNAYHEAIKSEVARQIEAVQALVDERLTVLNLYHDLEDRFEKQYNSCPFLQFLTVVGADQYLYTCQDKAYTQPGRMGFIEDRSLKGFWFSEENQKFLKSFNPSMQCGHHCVSRAKNLAIHDYLALDHEHANFV